jgi:hypothetical protein
MCRSSSGANIVPRNRIAPSRCGWCGEVLDATEQAFDPVAIAVQPRVGRTRHGADDAARGDGARAGLHSPRMS